MNAFASLLVTYLTAAAVTAVTMVVFYHDKRLEQSFAGLNWTSAVLGLAIVGLEFGYLMAYRAGWDISVGSLVANILLALALIPVGMLFYEEGFASSQVLGVVFCIVGLLLLNRS